MQPWILLGGGGSAEDEHEVFARFASRVGDRSVLYLPIAMREAFPDLFAGADRWVRESLGPLGVTMIETWYELERHDPADLPGFGAIFIGGGNTYALLDELRRTGFDRGIQQFVQRGGTVFGGSAGAAVLGRDISTIAHLDPNDVGLTDFRGLDLLAGRSAWVHYGDSERDLVRAHADKLKTPLIVMTERSGAELGQGGIEFFGPDDAFLVEPA